MDKQERRAEPDLSEDGAQDADAAEGHPEETRVGQIVHGLARVSRQLPALSTGRHAAADIATSALRERVGTLVIALGDPDHPLHQRAVDDLIVIGEPAVQPLIDALKPQRPWLTAYRATEALGQIGDGRAAGPLLESLRHPNSNVRWSAVRALTMVGDARALLELRRVARDDRGKTSWGESVAGAAQSALDQMQSRNLILRGADLAKTAVACVVMLIALTFAWNVFNELRTELGRVGRAALLIEAAAPLVVRTALPVPTIRPTVLRPTTLAQPTSGPALAPTSVVTATVLATGNVRSLPSRQADNVIGGVSEGDQIRVLATTPDRQWYRISLGERRAPGSKIESPDGSGWVNRSLILEPQASIPVEQVDLPTPAPTPAPNP